MKRISLTMALMAMTVATLFTACNTGTPRATLNTDLDTLGYSLGATFGKQVAQQIKAGQLPVDSAYMSDFYRGVREAFDAGDNKKKAAYYMGLLIGMNLNGSIDETNKQVATYDSTQTVARNNVLAAFLAAAQDKKLRLSPIQIDSALYNFKNMARTRRMEKLYGENRRAGEAFIAQVASQPGIQKTANGVYYKVITAGTGEMAGMNDRVKIDYEGRLTNGTVFDSSFQRGEPVTLHVGSMVPGFSEALKLMPMGSEWEIYIPQELAYGTMGTPDGSIEPYSALIFKVKTYEIVKQ